MVYSETLRSSMRAFKKGALRTALGGVVIAGGLEATTKLCSEGRSSRFYHDVADNAVVPAMRRFLHPETAHSVALRLACLAPTHRPSAKEQRLDVVVRLDTAAVFKNPIGLAAGYDKDGTAIAPLLAMGFGFVEVGSVCLEAQPGNPSPRMFRLVEDGAVINRYGFNSQGAEAVEENLRAYRNSNSNSSKSKSGATAGVVGINLGKNKTSTTPLEDYRELIRKLGPYADYLVVNVSCPNLSGLRDLQSANSLEALLRGCQQARDELATATRRRPPPLLVKLSPDLTDDELTGIASVLVKLGIDGIILTNTTTSRDESLVSLHQLEHGGLSGKPLKERSTECIRLLYRATGGSIPIIGVGGVFNGADAYEKLCAGASLVQVYTGMVYRGPGMVSSIRDEVAEIMIRNGQRDLQAEVIGSDHRTTKLKS
eukprot:jgi/Psemu1/202722/e_gw1.305.71.1